MILYILYCIVYLYKSMLIDPRESPRLKKKVLYYFVVQNWRKNAYNTGPSPLGIRNNLFILTE